MAPSHSPKFRAPVFDWTKITVPVSVVVSAVCATWVLSAKLNSIENRLATIEWNQGQKWTKSQQREYNNQIQQTLPSVHINTDSISVQIPY